MRVIEQYGLRDTWCRIHSTPQMHCDPASNGCLDAPAFLPSGAHRAVDGPQFHAASWTTFSEWELMR